MQPTDLAVERFHRYFHHANPLHDILEEGDRGLACVNLRRALDYVDVRRASNRSLPHDPEFFDSDLTERVKLFQRQYGHPIVDGRVGPNTRRRLIGQLLMRHDPGIFGRLQLDKNRPVSVFLSYAWGDADRVDRLDQWLRNNGVDVIRDVDLFSAGITIEENIRSAVARADKIIAIYSANSRDRDWPRLERQVAEEVERRLGVSILIYLCLDETPLPAPDPNRLAILAVGKPLRDVGAALMHALTGKPLPRKKIHVHPDQPL